MTEYDEDRTHIINGPQSDDPREELPSVLNMLDLAPSDVYLDQKSLDRKKLGKRIAQSTGVAALLSVTLAEGGAIGSASSAGALGTASSGGAAAAASGGVLSSLGVKLGLAGVGSFITGTLVSYGLMSADIDEQAARLAKQEQAYAELQSEFARLKTDLQQRQDATDVEETEAESDVQEATEDQAKSTAKRRRSRKRIPGLNQEHLESKELTAGDELDMIERGVNLYRKKKYAAAQDVFENYLSTFQKGQLKSDATMYLFDIALHRHYIKDALAYGEPLLRSGKHKNREMEIARNYLKAASEAGLCQQARSLLSELGIELSRKDREPCE